VLKDESDRARCRAFSHSIGYDRNLVTMRVPRSCLGEPQWVRFHVMNYREVDHESGYRVFMDNPHHHRPFPRGVTPRLSTERERGMPFSPVAA
jgi:hypothetical protein